MLSKLGRTIMQIANYYLGFAWRVAVVCGFSGLMIIGSAVLYDQMLINRLDGSVYAQRLTTRGQDAVDAETRNTIIRSQERIDQLNNRVSSLEQMRLDVRLSLIESTLATQSWFLKIIFAAACTQLLAWIAKGVSWASNRASTKKY